MCDNLCKIAHVVNDVHKTQIKNTCCLENASTMAQHVQKPMQNHTCCQSCSQNLNRIISFLKMWQTMVKRAKNQCSITRAVNNVHKTQVKAYVP